MGEKLLLRERNWKLDSTRNRKRFLSGSFEWMNEVSSQENPCRKSFQKLFLSFKKTDISHLSPSSPFIYLRLPFEFPNHLFLFRPASRVTPFFLSSFSHLNPQKWVKYIILVQQEKRKESNNHTAFHINPIPSRTTSHPQRTKLIREKTTSKKSPPVKMPVVSRSVPGFLLMNLAFFFLSLSLHLSFFYAAGCPISRKGWKMGQVASRHYHVHPLPCWLWTHSLTHSLTEFRREMDIANQTSLSNRT